MQKHNNLVKKNTEHSDEYWPFLILDPNNINQHRIIIFSLSSEGCLFICSEFIFPSTEMALERCRETSTRPPNSFIIFRMFFSQFLKIPNILSYDVGKRSKISKFAWEAAS